MTDAPIILRQIWIYPIKALGGVRLAEAEFSAAGSLLLDREWVIVDDDGQKLWQGDVPKMAVSRCTLDAEAVTVTMPGLPPLRVPRDHGGETRTMTMYGHSLDGIDAGDTVAEWLSDVFGRSMRLVRVGAAAHRRPNLNPVHVLSVASLAELNGVLAGRGDEPVEIERFRPNLVLEAGDALPAFFEEQHESIRFGGTELRFNEPCVRCELPNISRVTGSRGKQPLKLIGAMSRQRPTAAPASFGTYARLVGNGVLAEGTAGVAGPLRT